MLPLASGNTVSSATGTGWNTASALEHSGTASALEHSGTALEHSLWYCSGSLSLVQLWNSGTLLLLCNSGTLLHWNTATLEHSIVLSLSLSLSDTLLWK